MTEKKFKPLDPVFVIDQDLKIDVLKGPKIQIQDDPKIKVMKGPKIKKY